MPKISIALFGRNDNYGGNFLEKLKLSIKSIQRALKNIDYEIVLLDYNPPKDKTLLSEYFPNKKYPIIKHVVFSHEDHLEFIDCHLRAGAKLFYKDKDVSKRDIVNFIGTFAANLSIKYSTGDYILSTGTDNIFPIQFGGFIDNLEPNILYRTWMYRIYNNIKKIEKNSLNNFDKINDINETMFKRFNLNFKREKTIWNSAGNFILMDRNSWKETGGYLPTINPRPSMGDCQVVFHALTCGKKVKCANFPIFNIQGIINIAYKKYSMHLNYIVRNENIKYNHKNEMKDNLLGVKYKQWRIFRKWAMKSHLEPGKEYFIEISYKKRLQEIKKLFKSILPDKFLIC